MNTTKQYITDIINEDYKHWQAGLVLFAAAMNSGKTTFITKILAPYAGSRDKSILYLCNRSMLSNKVKMAVEEAGVSDIVTVATYQKIEDLLRSGEAPPDTDYIAADEVHYFTTDAQFNEYTDLSYDYIMAAKEQKVVILMSATADMMFRSLEDNGKVSTKNVYRIQPDYSYVDKLVFYTKGILPNLIDNILETEKDSKILVFVNDTNRMKEMHKLYRDQASFNCSQNAKKDLLRICDTNSIQNETFETRILFTTSVADNGIDLKDDRIRHVFSELTDIDALVQSLGRKRPLGENDHCIFYVRKMTPQGISGKKKTADRNATKAGEYLEDPDAFVSTNCYNRQLYNQFRVFRPGYPGYITDDKYLIMLNRMKYIKYQMERIYYARIENLGYIQTVITALDTKYFAPITTNLSEKNCPAGELFLEKLRKYEGKKLYVCNGQHKSIQQLFREDPHVGLKIKGDSPNIQTINGVMDQKCRDYSPRFESHKDWNRKLPNDEPNPYYGKKYWILASQNSI